jgi:hypothetical protein
MFHLSQQSQPLVIKSVTDPLLDRQTSSGESGSETSSQGSCELTKLTHENRFFCLRHNRIEQLSQT